MSKKITDYKTRGEEPDVLYAMFEEDTRELKHFQPNLFCIETAMGLRSEDLIKGVVKHNRLDEPSSTQRLVKIKIESVEYMK